jgi:uncharacterized membrane protein
MVLMVFVVAITFISMAITYARIINPPEPPYHKVVDGCLLLVFHVLGVGMLVLGIGLLIVRWLHGN